MKRKRPPIDGPISLKTLAKYLDLNPATASVVLNEVPGRSIPQATRERIKSAAKELNYQPSLLARSLRSRRTQTIGILVPELGVGYHTQVLSGIGDHLLDAGYFYFTAHRRHRKILIEQYSQMLLGRGAEALIAIDTALEHPFPVPVVCCRLPSACCRCHERRSRPSLRIRAYPHASSFAGSSPRRLHAWTTL